MAWRFWKEVIRLTPDATRDVAAGVPRSGMGAAACLTAWAEPLRKPVTASILGAFLRATAKQSADGK